MNKTYALVWNRSRRAWVATGETARRCGKSGGSRMAAAATLLGLVALPAFALPSGEAVTSGKADIVRSGDGRTMNINQLTDKLITNWNDFSVAGGERVSFNQPNAVSVALNRVIGNQGSQIDGQISANGRVFLVNPNGVLFGAGAQVNVGGLVASTKDISDADFQAGRYRFSGNSTRSIVNHGTLTAADGGSIALLGARVSNHGVIQAKLGRVTLAAGDAFTVNFDGSGLLDVQVDGGAVNAEASNGGLLKADGGDVLMTARAAGNLLDAVVNNTGVVEARGLNGRGGRITLDGGTVKVAGHLDASAGEAGAPAGAVTTRGERVDVAASAQVDTRAGNRAGTWTIAAANAGVNGANDSGRSIGADTLSRNLGTTSVELSNTHGDLVVGAPVSWASDNTLALESRQGNVDLRNTVSASGAHARLLVNAANRIRITDAVKLTGQDAHLELNAKNGHTFATEHAAVTLSGANASYRSNGNDYKVLHTLDDLRRIDGDLNGRYVLGNRIDGNRANFRSIGGNRAFGGVFDGLGNTIARVDITNPGGNAVGLFAYNTGWIGNLRLDSLSASSTGAGYNAALGSLVGVNAGGQIRNVVATNITVAGNGGRFGMVGGLVGRNVDGTIDAVNFSGRVSARNDSVSVGGLVGRNDGDDAIIANSHADADVSVGSSSAFARYSQSVGGLAGSNSGTIADSSSSGRVTGGSYMNVGGLVGENESGTLRRVSSDALVLAGLGSQVGGLAGYNAGTIKHASASGTVRSQPLAVAGGLVGVNALGGTIRHASATNTVTALRSTIGGLVGYNYVGGLIENASASGTIGGTGSDLGGLVAMNAGGIRSSTASTTINGNPSDNPLFLGGLVGLNTGWIEDSSTSGPAAKFAFYAINLGYIDNERPPVIMK
ncbi:filamentous hemagglutinin [Burkholderia lata]|uniref:Filamentous hemagglutinin n=1 Tax=Burkholderia lata (strain ATCC 17760 / DSM 23089 / LMG 22485 / NCIMB 9086 / R18194 / 383) TaxID=482957 RepID=A0A6P2YM84_BURL3|nr:GLUG motif-containing protein [Burkholderia lata]VWD21638.1 filamentous hemagglutinin [Burkholderia lata]